MGNGVSTKQTHTHLFSNAGRDACCDPAPPASLNARIQVVNEAYLKFQQNSMIIMEKNAGFSLRSLYLLCLDKYTVSVLNGMEGVRCVEVHGVGINGKMRHIWQLRTNVLACLVREGGRDVLLSDNDALWVKDPFLDLRTVGGDVLVQRGIMPVAFGDPLYGVTICMGFALFRAGGEGMSTFLDEILRAMKKVGDDQIAVNEAASRLRMQWIYSEGGSDMRNHESTRVGFGVLADLPGNFTVSFLPHSKYTRNCQATPISSETIVAHCFHRESRNQEMKRANLWLLQPGT